GPAAARAVVVAEPVSGDGAQPAAERAGSPALEARQFVDEDGHHFLDDVLGLLAEARVAQQPAAKEGPVQVVELPPGRLGRAAAQRLTQAGGRLHDGPRALMK